MIFLIAVVALGFAVMLVRDYLPRAEKPDVAQAKSDLAAAKRREASTAAKLDAAEQELEHTHRLAVASDAPLKRDSITYEFGRRRLDSANVDTVKAQLKRADNVIADQRVKIAALEADTASKAHVIIEQRALLAVTDEKFAALERLNAGIAAEIPTTGQKVKHDAIVAATTGAALMTLKLVFGK